jgi:hypothetical protein
MIDIRHGDCIAEMRAMDDACVDAIVTDPPYELGFMGKSWDASGIANSVEMWREALRVLKPGGHMLAFSGTRTYHRMVCAIEDAGFEIRDCIRSLNGQDHYPAWMYGTGFPKSLDVSKAIDKAAGAEREVIGQTRGGVKPNGGLCEGGLTEADKMHNVTAPATPEAQQWAGWGTALKPAWEPICVARKPLSEKTVAANVLKYGCGAINIDACRVSSVTGQQPIIGDAWENDLSLCASCAVDAESKTKHGSLGTKASTATNSVAPTSNARGAMSLHGIGKMDTGCSDGMRLDDMSISSNIGASGKMPTDPCQTDTKSTTTTKTGATTGLVTCSSCGKQITSRTTSGNTTAERKSLPQDGNSSVNAAPEGRFPANVIHDGSDEVLAAFAAFGESKSAKGGSFQREMTSRGYEGGGLGQRKADAHEAVAIEKPGYGDAGSPARFFYSAKASKADRADSKHPTVKPLSLMKYLCRLVCPPGGTVLDPFAGSGTTLQAAMEEGFSAIGIEQSAEYVTDIRNRIGAAREGLGLFAVAAE